MLADALIHRVNSIGDADARVALLRALCPTLPPDELEAVRAELSRRAGQRETAAQIALLALSEALTPPPKRPGPREAAAASASGASNDWGTGRPLTLGERKSLARRPDRRLLERALRDVHPDVIAEVLRNPRLTEADVARMCSSPHVSPAVLVRVFTTPRWAARELVREALAANPRTPPQIALPLLPMLSREGLKGIADDLRVDEAVRARARALAFPGREGPAPREASAPEELEALERDAPLVAPVGGMARAGVVVIELADSGDLRETLEALRAEGALDEDEPEEAAASGDDELDEVTVARALAAWSAGASAGEGEARPAPRGPRR